jgi:hypothetical protein
MFKRICKAMLKEENYIDALAYFCEKIEKASDKGQDLEALWDKFDDQLWNLAISADDTIEDASDNALRISSALRTVIDSEMDF